MKITIIQKDDDISLMGASSCYALRHEQRINTIEELCTAGKDAAAKTCKASIIRQLDRHLTGCCDCSFGILLVDADVLNMWSPPDDAQLRKENMLYRNVTEAIGYTTPTLQDCVLRVPDASSVTPELIQKEPYFGQLLRAQILRLASKKFIEGDVGISHDELAAALKNAADSDVIRALVDAMLKSRVITRTEDLYLPALLPMREYYNARYEAQSKCRVTLDRVLEGVPKVKIAQEMNISRQAATQRALTAFSKRPLLAEDKYSAVFRRFHIQKDIFCEVTGEPPETYYYLDAAYNGGRLPLKRILNERSNLRTVLEFQKYLTTHSTDVMLVMPDGFYDSDAHTIFNYVLKGTTEAVTLPDFCMRHNELVASLGLPEEKEKRLMVTVKTFSRNMCLSPLTVWSQHRRFRYYDMAAHDFAELYRYTIDYMQHSGQFDETTGSIFNSAPSLMEQYDIRNDGELHNIFRKTVEDYLHVPGVDCIKILRMNRIVFLNKAG